MEVLQGIMVGKHSLRIDFGKILNEWIECTKKYVDYWEGDDLPYWYNERANVSVLAGAAWRAGFIALEEYQIVKESSEKEYKIGRNDLFLSDRENDIYIEAKVLFPEIGSLNIFEQNGVVKEKHNQAVSDANEIKDESKLVGALFIAPYLNDNLNSDNRICSFIAEIEKYDAPIKAWCFSKEWQKATSHNDRHYPGVALLLDMPKD
mgnify:CR=1 FL=1